MGRINVRLLPGRSRRARDATEKPSLLSHTDDRGQKVRGTRMTSGLPVKRASRSVLKFSWKATGDNVAAD